MRLAISPTPSNTPSNTPSITPSPSNCPGSISCMEIESGFNAQVVSILIQPSGKYIVGGQFTTYAGISSNRLIGLNNDGSIDNSFNVGSGLTGIGLISIRAMAFQSDGKILIACTSVNMSYDGNVTKGIFRVNADGSFDNTFAPETFNSGPVNLSNVALDSSQKIYVAGAITSYSGNSQNGIIRLNADGSKDTSFDIGIGFSGVPDTQVIIPQSDGKIFVGGNFTSYSGVSANRLIRLNNDGSIDNTFNYGTGFDDSVRNAVQQSDGKYIIVGHFTSYSGQSAGRIIRLNNDGSIDNTFDTSVGLNGNAQTVLIQSDGKIVVGGFFTEYSGETAARICRLNTDGSFDTTFNSGGAGFSSGVQTIKQQSDGKLLVGGSFSSYNTFIAVNRIIRLNTDGSSNMCSEIPYVQFTVTSGTTAEEACASTNSFIIYTQPFDDSACSDDLSGWACLPQDTQGASLDPDGTIDLPNGFYASEFQPGVIGVYEYDGDFGNWSICGGATPTPTITPTITPTPTNTPTNELTPTPSVTSTNTSTPTPTPTNGTVEYDVYTADEYSCPGCTVLSSGVLVAFPAGQSVTIGRWYPDEGDTSHTYLITGTSTGAGYILTNIFGSFTSCGAACAI